MQRFIFAILPSSLNYQLHYILESCPDYFTQLCYALAQTDAFFAENLPLWKHQTL